MQSRFANCTSRRKSVPIYEYYCADCKTDFDKLVKISDANAKQECPECGGRHTQKKLSTFATSGGSIGQGAAASSCGSGGGRFS
jgi:putative FmdB family regulatory protein